MFTFKKRLRRRVLVSRKHGALIVRIGPHNDRPTYILLLAAFTVVVAYFMYVFIRPFFYRATLRDLLYMLPFIAFVSLWYVIGLRIGLWRAFGIEQIVIEDGRLSWSGTALFWKRNLEIPVTEITDIKAVTPWHSLSNHVEVTASGRRRSVGDMLLRNEATELAHELKHSISLAG